MILNEYRYVIEFSRKDGTPVGQVPVAFDWEPATEFLRWAALRSGNTEAGDVRIRPKWHPTYGQPYASGAEVIGGAASAAVLSDYFAAPARQLSSGFVEKGLLQEGEYFVYKVAAFPGRTEATAEPGEAPFMVSEVATALPLKETPLADLMRNSVLSGEGNDTDMPALIPQSVLNETASLAREAGAFETGGVLIGHLCRDRTLPEIAAVVTAQIPAKHTEAGSVKLTFTCDTWTSVRAALKLRKSRELMLGWWHSHPSFAWCGAECSEAKRKVCPLQKAFLSTDDVLLHRAIFVKSYSIALLVNNADSGLEHVLFGWRRGVVHARGFHITNGPGSVPTKGDNHAKT